MQSKMEKLNRFDMRRFKPMQEELTKLRYMNSELVKALELAMLCSNYHDAKKSYGQNTEHWTNVIAETLKKASA